MLYRCLGWCALQLLSIRLCSLANCVEEAIEQMHTKIRTQVLTNQPTYQMNPKKDCSDYRSAPSVHLIMS